MPSRNSRRCLPNDQKPLAGWRAAAILPVSRGDYYAAVSFGPRRDRPIRRRAPWKSGGTPQERAALLRQPGGKFYDGVLTRLTNRPADGKRVEIPVGFKYAQHHQNPCAPATLTAIAKFWAMPVEHVELAEEISYAGTPHHSERKWAAEHGWHTKEFTVTWDAAVALIDRGIPFTLTTAEVSSRPRSGRHRLRDSMRGTLIARDPTERHRLEIPFAWMKERYQPPARAASPWRRSGTRKSSPRSRCRTKHFMISCNASIWPLKGIGAGRRSRR